MFNNMFDNEADKLEYIRGLVFGNKRIQKVGLAKVKNEYSNLKGLTPFDKGLIASVKNAEYLNAIQLEYKEYESFL